MVTRRQMIGGGAAFLAAPRHALAGGIETADVLGTPVSLPRRPQRIVLLDATDILSMAALLPDPAERVVGWASAGRLDLGAMTERLAPSLPEVGKLSPDTVSVESVLALEPDLVVASAYMLPPQGSPLSEILRASGIPIAWTSGHNGALSPSCLCGGPWRSGAPFWARKAAPLRSPTSGSDVSRRCAPAPPDPIVRGSTWRSCPPLTTAAGGPGARSGAISLRWRAASFWLRPRAGAVNSRTKG